jgi:predicted signal transduction protein with EAL and GGDEF domain
VNMSAEIGCSDGFEEAIVEVVLSTGLALSGLSVEVEDAALRRFSPIKLAKLDDLTSRGMELSLDDFGKGYKPSPVLTDFRFKQSRSTIAWFATFLRALLISQSLGRLRSSYSGPGRRLRGSVRRGDLILVVAA